MTTTRTGIATRMALRDQLRRPLVIILLVLVPAYVVIRSVAVTEPEPRRIELPAGVWITTTMRDLHGPEMAKMSVAFVAALVGVFVMQSALQADRRLVIAGYRRRQVLAGRGIVILAAVGIVTGVAAIVTGVAVPVVSWPPVIAALLLTGLTYAAIGAIAGAVLDRLAATYCILFLALTDFGVVQTPMFHPKPTSWAPLLPGYGATRVMLDGTYASAFRAWPELGIALGWTAAAGGVAYLILRRALPATPTSTHIPPGGIVG